MERVKRKREIREVVRGENKEVEEEKERTGRRKQRGKWK